jgi:hypothetical protein
MGVAACAQRSGEVSESYLGFRLLPRHEDGQGRTRALVKRRRLGQENKQREYVPTWSESEVKFSELSEVNFHVLTTSSNRSQ